MGTLRWGDRVILHAWGQRYIYEIRWVGITKPNDSSVLDETNRSWLTLITCKGYNEALNTYSSRVVAQAVLLRYEKDTTGISGPAEQQP
ncbi:MAG TPA: sortase [Anaerolineaceae bacterium]|nr:sortase [Anaerolineaceae bacterium]HNZ12391.1 sortase [Anaerolineaceae bacterium]HOD06116.1 sortase [Anaerolineaceae bacterium]HQN44407.1 sortase [Anaerolineaceae bacterium]